MTEFRPIIINFLLIGMFAFALISAGIIMATNNNVDHSIGDNPSLTEYKDNLETQLSEVNTNANQTETALGQSPVTVNDAGFTLDSIGGIWKSIKVIPISIYNLTVGFISSMFFGSPALAIILTAFGGIVTITLIFAIWKWLRTGEGG